MVTNKQLAKSVTTLASRTTTSTRSISPELKKFMEEERKLVKGRFKNYETPGGNLPLTCLKYPGEPLFSENFVDGEIYTVPLWIARHLNGTDVTAKAIDGKIGSCSYVVHGFKWADGKPAPQSILGPQGVPIPNTQTTKRKQRFGFESLEFASGDL